MLFNLPSELVAVIISYVGPQPSHLKAVLGVSRAMNEAGWNALAAGFFFESLHQRKLFLETLQFVQGFPSISNKENYIPTNECEQFVSIPFAGKVARLAATLRHIDFGFRPTNAAALPPTDPTTPPNTPFPNTSSEFSSQTTLNFDYAAAAASQIRFYGSQWDHRFVADELLQILQACPNLRSLNLSGCQFRPDSIEPLQSALRSLPAGIRTLTLSHSSLKGNSLVSIVTACAPRLRVLDITGLCRFRRVRTRDLERILAAPGMMGLERIVAKQCPDLDEDWIAHMRTVYPKVRWVLRDVDEGVSVTAGLVGMHHKPAMKGVHVVHTGNALVINPTRMRSVSTSRLDRMASIDSDGNDEDEN
ncbi:hypothetical protein HDU81_000484 [Chytriomyces hyalinus]|nr:hypothetical protein HDU81_000484 [Chytriomyces hyalinus]